MNRFPTDFDKECADGLSVAELSELVIGYAQENERLEAENKRLRYQQGILLRTSRVCRQYIQDVRAAETAVRRFVSDPSIAPYIPNIDTTMRLLFGDPASYGGGAGD